MFEPEDIPLKKKFIDVLNSALTLGNNAEATHFNVLVQRMVAAAASPEVVHVFKACLISSHLKLEIISARADLLSYEDPGQIPFIKSIISGYQKICEHLSNQTTCSIDEFCTSFTSFDSMLGYINTGTTISSNFHF